MQRQYTGTAGKIDNCQLAVHLSYASPAGHTLVGVALYLPKAWTDDPPRHTEAGAPDTVTFATKPQLARHLIETAVAGGLPCRWVAGDEAYGGDPQLAAALRGHDLGYVLAVACSHRVPTGLGVQRADQIAAGLPKQAWQRISAGAGAKGYRYYDWAFITLPHTADQHQDHHWLLIRCNRTTGELAFYRCWSPRLVKGLVYCGLCHRKMQGQRSNGEAYYRCRYAQEYALANKIDHLRNVYLRELDVVTDLDAALAGAFVPDRISDTVAMMAAAQDPDPVEEEPIRQARARLADCDARLTKYRAALDAGADPVVVTGWISEVQGCSAGRRSRC